MSWKLRHTGSPQAISNLTPQQIAEGLAEGDYEPGDEVMGPSDNRWIPMEEHPHFVETVEAYNESLDPEEIDGSEDHIDMNPLIPRAARVLTGPAEIQFTRIFFGPRS